MKKNYIITADSGCIPGQNILTDPKEIPIKTIPALIIDENDQEYLDLIDITPKEITNRNNQGEIFKTASPYLSSYEKTFTEALEIPDTVFHVSMGESISSSSLNNAYTEANLLNQKYGKHIYVIDSKAGATTGKLIVTLIEQLIKDGYSANEIYDKIIHNFIPRIQTSFIVPDVTGFIRSGRNKTTNSHLMNIATKFASKAINKLKLQPQVDVVDGQLHIVKCYRGKQEQLAILNLIKQNIEKLNQADQQFIVYGTIASEESSMEKAKNYLQEKTNFKHLIRQDISGVVAAYGSENLCGISYVKKLEKSYNETK